jgi:hypothetical protein
MNIAEATLALYSGDRNTLAETCYYLHKDQYGTKGQHLLRYTSEELVGWLLTHYYFSETDQCWCSKE